MGFLLREHPAAFAPEAQGVGAVVDTAGPLDGEAVGPTEGEKGRIAQGVAGRQGGGEVEGGFEAIVPAQAQAGGGQGGGVGDSHGWSGGIGFIGRAARIFSHSAISWP